MEVLWFYILLARSTHCILITASAQSDVSQLGQFCSQSTTGSVWRHLWLPQLCVWGVYTCAHLHPCELHWAGSGQGAAAQCPAVCRCSTSEWSAPVSVGVNSKRPRSSLSFPAFLMLPVKTSYPMDANFPVLLGLVLTRLFQMDF